MSEKPIILVTGVTGFIGSHVAFHLLQTGYRVKGTARTAKIDELRKTAGAQYPEFEVVPVDDLVAGDYTEALKGVHAVMHIASPLVGKADPETTVHWAVEGTLNLLRQAAKQGVKKVVLTGSAVSIAKYHGNKEGGVIWTDEPSKVLTEKDWSDLTFKEGTAEGVNPFLPYIASKIVAERAAWEFVEEHPEIDLATIHPPFVYGPYVPHFPPLDPRHGTNGNIYLLVIGPKGRPAAPQVMYAYVDVRDVARAHVAALSVPPVADRKDLQSKRFLVSAGALPWLDAVNYLRKARPELADRLPLVEEQNAVAEKYDTSRSAKVLGITTYIPLEKTLDDTVNAVLEFEKSQA